MSEEFDIPDCPRCHAEPYSDYREADGHQWAVIECLCGFEAVRYNPDVFLEKQNVMNALIDRWNIRAI
jgi:hypothetical protein